MRSVEEVIAKGKALCEEVWQDMSLYDDNYANAIECFQEVLSIDPHNVNALINLGAVLSDIGRHKEALVPLSQAEEIGSDDRNLFYNRAVAMMNINMSTRIESENYFKMASTKVASEKTIEAYFDPQAH